ncbi:hypothetical protein PAPYR_86 [Paratrimastix pyriformis]|uniref:Uncharacterized protein n=1 Tax=Paratrimastix pyriformis TaxID=342808 RepID=A0ABQ8UVH6_9EUKA|nr:hypothetical protein PAPYR_86 [Paratrimastix pyriformis]
MTAVELDDLRCVITTASERGDIPFTTAALSDGVYTAVWGSFTYGSATRGGVNLWSRESTGRLRPSGGSAPIWRDVRIELSAVKKQQPGTRVVLFNTTIPAATIERAASQQTEHKVSSGDGLGAQSTSEGSLVTVCDGDPRLEIGITHTLHDRQELCVVRARLTQAGLAQAIGAPGCH